MKTLLSLVVVLGMVACGGAVDAPESKLAAMAAQGSRLSPLLTAPGNAIPGSYIVRIKDGHRAEAVAAQHGAKPHHVYSVLNGFAAHLTAAQLDAVRRHPGVAYVEEDQVFTADAVQYGPDWGLDRIDQHNLPLNNAFSYNYDGTGVRAYVIDTGIATGDSDFGGRASAVYDAMGGNGQDCNGHGTHVAGTIGGATYGVAKNSKPRAVRVLDCNGSGSTSNIIAGINWVQTNAIHPAVANMSLGGGFSQSLNDAATALANSGVSLAVAAGNSNADACNTSPASAPGTITVAASDINDNRASFSNYGGCVDVYGPGVNITSDWLNGGTNTISGTSMASPHVAGVAALYKQAYGDQPSSTVYNFIVNNATANVIRGNPSGTVNRLLYTGGL